MADTAIVRMLEDVFDKVDGRIRTVAPTLLPVVPRVVDIPLVLGTRGVVLAVNDHVFFRLGLNGTVQVISWSIAGTISGSNASGTIRVDVQVGSTLTAAASICGGTGNQPQLSAQAELAEQTPSGWTTQIEDPSWIKAIVASTGGTLEVVGLTLRCLVIPR